MQVILPPFIILHPAWYGKGLVSMPQCIARLVHLAARCGVLHLNRRGEVPALLCGVELHNVDHTASALLYTLNTAVGWAHFCR